MKISESEIIYENVILGVHFVSGLTRLVNKDKPIIQIQSFAWVTCNVRLLAFFNVRSSGSICFTNVRKIWLFTIKMSDFMKLSNKFKLAALSKQINNEKSRNSSQRARVLFTLFVLGCA